MSEILLGIDAGTSSVKVCAYTREGKLLGRAGRQVQVISPRPSWAEMDAEAYWQKVTEAVREAVPEDGRVVSVGISSTCPAVIVMDGALRPLRPATVYLDQRSDAVIREVMRRNGGPEAHFARAGNRPGCSSSWLGTLAWIREQEPELWKRVRHVSLLGGFLAARLTGRLTMDWTQASYSGGFRVGEPEKGWDEELLARWGVGTEILPELGWSCLPAGNVTPEAGEALGIGTGAAAAFGAADTAAASFAVGIRNAGDVFESAGTSGVITFCLDRPDFDDTFMNRCHILPGRWLAHGAMSTLGGAFAWLRSKVWPDLRSMTELEQLAAESRPGANGLIFLPYLSGERSPIWDPCASGSWVGLRLDHTRADMIRAVFEGTAFGLRQIIDRGAKRWGSRPRQLLGVGGGSRSRLWSAVKSGVLEVEYQTADEPDAAAWGAALLGGTAGGIFSGADDPDIVHISGDGGSAGEAGGGRADSGAYARAFAVYEKLYPALMPAMHQLMEGAGR